MRQECCTYEVDIHSTTERVYVSSTLMYDFLNLFLVYKVRNKTSLAFLKFSKHEKMSLIEIPNSSQLMN